VWNQVSLTLVGHVVFGPRRVALGTFSLAGSGVVSFPLMNFGPPFPFHQLFLAALAFLWSAWAKSFCLALGGGEPCSTVFIQ
jgi:hypothetical protein